MRFALHMFTFVLLAACGATNTPQSPASSAVGAVVDPWFCQVGETNDDWDCIRSEALAKTGKPTRLPEPRKDSRPTPNSLASPELLAAAQPNALSARSPRQPQRANTQSTVTPASPPTAQTKNAQVRPVEKTETAKRDVPIHVALSYRPPKPTPILELPGEFFAVQLVAVSSKQALEDFAKKHKIKGMSAARTYNGEDLFYVLLLGIYETRANAIASVESLAPPFDTMTPWIRSLGSLQESMLEADRVAGTTDI